MRLATVSPMLLAFKGHSDRCMHSEPVEGDECWRSDLMRASQRASAEPYVSMAN